MEPLASFSGPISSNAPDQKRESFKVFIGFDTMTAEAEALNTAQYVRGQLSDEFEVNLATWDLAYLGAPRLRDRAASEAATADMIIISSSEDSAGAEHLKQWISKWKDKRKKGGALVALIKGDPQDGNMGVLNLLEKTAEGAEMDFFSKYSRKKD